MADISQPFPCKHRHHLSTLIEIPEVIFLVEGSVSRIVAVEDSPFPASDLANGEFIMLNKFWRLLSLFPKMSREYKLMKIIFQLLRVLKCYQLAERKFTGN